MNRFTEFKISVNKDDIKLGKRNMGEKCPIARAAKRALKAKGHKVEQVFVTNVLDFQLKNREPQGIGLPREVTKFITAFDDKESVKPFSFIIKVSTKKLTTPWKPWGNTTGLGW